MGKEFHIKGSEKLLNTIRNFSATEKFIFGIFVIIITASALSLALKVNRLFMVSIPSSGGTYSEGIVGLPRYINPVLAFTDTDKDLSSFVYSGLTKYSNKELIPDLAEKYSVSDDGLTYTFILRDDLRFHDGVPLTTDDVEFTIQKIQDSIIKSPRRADWANISVKKIDAKEIQFILKQPYAPFLSNTTLGIIPKHIWSKVDPDQFIYSHYNIEPIGSGPYRLLSIKHDNGGIPEYYSFTPFKRYHGQKAYISNLLIYLYPNEKKAIEAYSSGIIDGIAGISPSEAQTIAEENKNVQIIHTPLPRIFGVFFNQNQSSVLAQIDVRKALDMTLNKEEIVQKVLSGYGVVSDSPLPVGIATKKEKNKDLSTTTLDIARNILIKSGWILNENGVFEKKDKKGTVTQTLEFSISTVDAPDLKKTAELLKTQWEALGAKITIKVFEYGDLYQNIIATRKYDSLLFGEFIGKDMDLYAFWHSSQRNSPGLNLASYVNSEVNKLLEDARNTFVEKTRREKYAKFESIIQEELPAIFLYSPEFIYVLPEEIYGVNLDQITSPSDRFTTINKWYTKTSYVWKIFAKNNIENN